MSFLTDVTPLTPRATATAWSMLACDLTKPLNCTRPLKVSTLISADFNDESLNIAVFTLVVTQAGSGLAQPHHSSRFRSSPAIARLTVA